MAEFKSAFLHTMSREGGYSNNPADRGGETFRGIARNFHPDWPGWSVIDAIHVDTRDGYKGDPELTKLVADFYRGSFWNPLRLTEIDSQVIANELFDSAVNAGVGAAARWLQRAVNLLSQPDISVDGKVGSKTIGAVNLLISTVGEGPLLKTLNILQGMHYLEIVERSPSQEVFFKGWLTRVWEVR